MKHVYATKLSHNERAIPGSQEHRDRTRVEEPTTDIDLSAQLSQESIELLKILRSRIGNDVDISRRPEVSPGIYRQASDQDESNLCGSQALEELAET